MPVFETPGGTRMDINLPQTEWPELQGAVEAYATLRRELRATRARCGAIVATASGSIRSRYALRSSPGCGASPAACRPARSAARK